MSPLPGVKRGWRQGEQNGGAGWGVYVGCVRKREGRTSGRMGPSLGRLDFVRGYCTLLMQLWDRVQLSGWSASLLILSVFEVCH